MKSSRGARRPRKSRRELRRPLRLRHPTARANLKPRQKEASSAIFSGARNDGRGWWRRWPSKPLVQLEASSAVRFYEECSEAFLAQRRSRRREDESLVRERLETTREGLVPQDARKELIDGLNKDLEGEFQAVIMY